MALLVMGIVLGQWVKGLGRPAVVSVLLIAIAAAVREFVLGQSAFDPNDAFSPPSTTRSPPTASWPAHRPST